MPILSAKDKSSTSQHAGGFVADREDAFKRADKAARRVGKEVSEARRKRLMGKLIPVAIALVGAAFAALFGTGLAETEFGRVVISSLGPLVQIFMNIDAWVYAALGVLAGIGGVMWFIRS
jgi:hypothetical protein